jgi:hypothetical protein
MVICFIVSPVYPAAAERKSNEGDRRPEKRIPTVDSTQIECYESEKYLIVAKEIKGRSGTDFLIKQKLNPSAKLGCRYVPRDGDFEIKNEWAEYFAGLKKDLLILDSTTGPGPSGLIIWDLSKRKKVYEGSWSDPEESGDDSLIFWMETGEATRTNCPELENWELKGLGGAIETRVILDLSSFRITKTLQTRCSARQ